VNQFSVEVRGEFLLKIREARDNVMRQEKRKIAEKEKLEYDTRQVNLVLQSNSAYEVLGIPEGQEKVD